MKNPYKKKATYRPLLGSGTKTVKGEKIGFLTGILYLLPSLKICAMSALAGCIWPCLNTAGRGAFTSTQKARDKKTQFFHDQIEAFMWAIAADIWSLIRKADKLGMVLLIRLNGTSDILWENIRLDAWGGKTIFEMFPNVQFYDYTKHPARNVAHIPNYDLTYSYSGITPEKITLKAISQPNARVAVVFHKRSEIPATFRGWPVIDGDETDVRHIEPGGVVVALYAKAKAKAKRETDGFVQRAGVHY
jgi:hypothetical protein